MNVLMLVHDGFEEVEALTAVDLLRRAGVTVTVASMTGKEILNGSHGIRVIADALFENLGEEALSRCDCAVLPGGLPNAHTLRDDERVIRTVKDFCAGGKLVAAICAAPCVLERAGLLTGKKATSYPGAIDGSKCLYSEEPVARDGNLITSRGVGTAIPFALELIRALGLPEKAEAIGHGIIYN